MRLAGAVSTGLLAVTLAVSPAWCPERALADSPKIKIGISTALTGSAATYGQDVKDGILFAAKVFAPERYEFVIEDDKCSGKDAVTVAQKLIHVDKVQYVIGFACSGAALAAAPAYEAAKIPVIVTCASAPKISEAGKFIFRTTPSDTMAAAKLSDHLLTKHYQSVAVLTEQTEYALGLQEAFSVRAAAQKLKVTAEEYITGTTDFRSLLLKLKQQNPDGLFVNAQTEETTAAIVKQIREMHWAVPLYSAYWASSPAFLKLLGSEADGIEVVDTPPLDGLLNAEGQGVYQRFRDAGGEVRSIETIFASSVEALRALDSVLREQPGMTPEQVTAALGAKKFQGIFGPYSFDVNGDIVGLDFVIKRIEGGAAKVIPLQK